MRSLPIHHCTLCVHYPHIIAYYVFTSHTSLHTMHSLATHHCTLCVHYPHIIAHYALTIHTSLHTIRSLSAHYTQTIRTSHTHYTPTSCDMLSSWPWLPVSCTATCCSSRWAVDSAELSPAGDWISSRRLTREAWRGEESGSGRRDEGEEREGGERRVRVRA